MPSRATAAGTNPLTAPWPGPHGGVPPFDVARVDDLGPALEAGMADQLAEVERIAADPRPPTFENTIAALERAGRMLARVETVYGVWTSALSDDAVQRVERTFAPRLADCSDRIVQNERLFARIAAVHESRERAGLSPEQQRVVRLTHAHFLRHGARLVPAAKAELSALNRELAALATAFSQNLLRDESEVAWLFTADELAGLPPAQRDAAAATAAARGQPGRWAIPNTRSSVEPFLTHAAHRPARERVWRMFVDRGAGGGDTDNHGIVARMLAVRGHRARLLGHPTHAHWRLEDSMAKTPARALALLEAIWQPAVATARAEVAEMQAVADAEGAAIRIAPWDYRFYAEKVRRARYDLDDAEIAPYLQLDNLREALFFTAGRLFGLSFRPASPRDVPVYHADVRVWEVRDAAGAVVGLWYFDPFARPGKQSGAWMSSYRQQEDIDGPVCGIVSNNCNFSKPPPGEPALVSWDDATTLFHEFGHALHGLCSRARYPSVSGTNVPRDYVEFPSQILEHWLSTPEVLERFAVHHETGRPIPADLVAKIASASAFNVGFKTVEFLASALVDMRLHLLETPVPDAPPIDAAALERDTLRGCGMPEEIVMRHRTPHFSHIFSGDGYSAGYYSYLWADMLTADAWEAFTEAGGPWDEAVATRLRDHVLAAGNTIDPEAGYRAFRGRDADLGPLLRKRGFRG